MPFFYNYNTPGPGVDVNAPPKKAWKRFFELYWRKFSRFVIFNAITFLFMLPIITLILWLLFFAVASTMPDIAEEGGGFICYMQAILLPVTAVIPPPVLLLLLLASAVFYGPVMCGITYVYRNYSREEHAWHSDFWSQMKKNFRQGAVLGFLELSAVSLLTFNIFIQPEQLAGSAAVLTVVKFVSVFMLILVYFARRYTYAIVITFKLPLRTIIKNSFAFAFVGLWRNAGLAAVDTSLIFLMLLINYFDIFFLPLFFFSFTGFLSVFVTFPLVDKHMLKPALERKAKAAEMEEGE
jgi:uncharacterized membrane protein YesL